jgi:hypothetical protein
MQKNISSLAEAAALVYIIHDAALRAVPSVSKLLVSRTDVCRRAAGWRSVVLYYTNLNGSS